METIRTTSSVWPNRSKSSKARNRLRIATLDGEAVDVGSRALDDFAARLDGRLLEPGDTRFDEAVGTWNAMISKTPALVVQPVSVRDVQHAIRFARAWGLLLSVKGGGHNIAGTSLADGGMTLDMSRMATIDVDRDRRAARVGPGCRLGDVDRVTQEHGLATVLGFVSRTGVAGLTLGGGFGYLTRRFGWTVDNLEEVEIVTADGEVRRAASDEHEDLFWAVRGGGGNFGVVTRFTFRLHDVGPDITAGLVLWDAEESDEVVALYREAAEAAPRELTLAVMMRLAPPAPFVPEAMHGKPVIALIACHTGDSQQALTDLAPIRSFGRPIADRIVRKRYAEQQSMFDATQPDGLNQYWKSEFLPGLSGGLLETYRKRATRITSPMSQATVFQLGGAALEGDATAASFANRDAAYIFLGAGTWPPGAGDDEVHREWVRSTWEAILPYSTGGNYINVQTVDEDETRLRGAYRDNLEHLARVKAIYDSDNLFRVNRNIAPARRRLSEPV
jgi:FAD/FMN-containing dehydrogenase